MGFGIATVHTEHEKELTRKIGAKELPHIILLIEGRIKPLLLRRVEPVIR